MVAVLQVSRSGFYAWRKSGLAPRARAVKLVGRDVLVKKAFDDFKARNGSSRIQVDLAEHSKKPDIKTILNSMER
jgi:hypothetical protein